MDDIDTTFSAVQNTLHGVAQTESVRGNAARQATSMVSQAYAQQANAAKQMASASSLAIDAQAKKLDAVNDRIDAQKAKVTQLGLELKRALGFQNANEGSPRVQKLQAEVEKATNELANLEVQSDKTAAALIKMEDAAAAMGEKQAIVAQKMAEAQELAEQKAEALADAAINRQNRSYAQMVSMVSRLTGAFQGSSKELRTITTVANIVAQSLGMAGRTGMTSGQMIAAGGKMAGDGVAAGAATAGRGISAAMPWITAMGVALNVVISIIGIFKRKSEEATEAERKAAEARRESIVAQRESLSTVGSLSDEYGVLSAKTDKTSEEKRRLTDIEQMLSREHGISLIGLNGQKKGYEELNATLRETLQLKRIEGLIAVEKNAMELIGAPDEEKIAFLRNSIEGTTKLISDLQDMLERGGDKSYELYLGRTIQEEIDRLEEVLLNNTSRLAEALKPRVDAAWDAISASIQQKTPEITGYGLHLMEAMYRTMAEANPSEADTVRFVEWVKGLFTHPELQQSIETLKEQLAQIDPAAMMEDGFTTQREAHILEFIANLEEAGISAFAAMGIEGDHAGIALTRFQEIVRGLIEGFDGAEEAGEKLGDEWREGFERAVQGATRNLSSILSSKDAIDEDLRAWQVLSDERLRGTREFEAAQDRINKKYGEGAAENLEHVRARIHGEENYFTMQEENAQALAELRRAQLSEEIQALTSAKLQTDNAEERLAIETAMLPLLDEQRQLLHDIAQPASSPAEGYTELQMQIMGATAEANRLKAAMDTSKAHRDNIKAQRDFANGIKDSSKLVGQQKADFQALMTIYNAADLKDLKAKIADAFTAAEDGADNASAAYTLMIDRLMGNLSDLENYASGLDMHSEVYIDTQQAMDDLRAVIEYAVSNGLELTGGGGKGGGGRKNAAEDARKVAEEARRAQEAAWQKRLDDQLRYLERKKRLGEIDTQEEIRQLEIIMKKYAKTAEQKRRLDDMLFEARARLRDEEISEIDKLNQGIITALRNRYDEQRKVEEKRLDESSQSWRDWGDANVKAIQAQIDALDDLNKFEDREEQERKKVRKIEATRQMLEYTTDDANREQLQKELERLEADLAKWRRQNEISDAKEQLRAEQEAIRERVQAEQEGIDQQRDAMRLMYDDLTKDAALRAEAERMLTQSSQEDILRLIGDFAPDYEATGKTLGERLHAGLMDKLGPIVDWFKGLNDQIIAIQDRAQQAALDAADAFYTGSHGGQGGAAGQANTPPQVNVVNNFNVPVESPADTQRRIEQANEDLALLLT